ncbi:MAG: TonB-dependent receptor [Verrucomicrobiota bacterium]|nr:TonB-dependent receptor [Verrucomicrobiota bacterium]
MKKTYTASFLGLLSMLPVLSAQDMEDRFIVALEPYIVAEETAAAYAPGAQVTSLPEYVLETANISKLTDLIALTPNFRAGGGGLRSFGDILQMRGIGNTPYFSSPGVLVAVDDVPQGDVFATSTSLHDIDRIEIYRGPQPLLQGRTAPAGAIQIITKRPTNLAHGRVYAEYSRFDTYEAGARVTTPLVDDAFYVSASANYNQSEGFINNTTLGRNTDSRQSTAGRLSFLWTPDVTWEIALSFNGEKNNDGSQRIVPLGNAWNTDASDLSGESDSRRDSESLRISKKFEGMQVSLISARQDWKLDPFTIDYDFSPYPAVTSDLSQQQRHYSQEFRLESDPDFKEPVSWILGGIYYDSTTRGAYLRQFAFPLDDGSFYSGYEKTSHKINEEGGALYAQVNYQILPSLELSGGLRADVIKKSMNRVRATEQGPNPDINRSRKDVDYSPVLSAKWRPNHAITFTARHVRSMQAGGFSAYTNIPNAVEFDAERIRAWELGAIWEPIAKHLRIELSTFYYQLNNYQVERSFSNVDYIVVNAPKATSKGFELETIASPIEGMELTASAGLLNVTFDEYVDPYNADNFEGKHAPYAPDFTFALSASYTVQRGPLNGLGAHIGYRLIGKTYFNEANDPTYYDSGYGLLDARISYAFKGWSLYVFGSNLTDSRFHSFILPELSAGVPGDPRTYGVGTSYTW